MPIDLGKAAVVQSEVTNSWDRSKTVVIESGVDEVLSTRSVPEVGASDCHGVKKLLAADVGYMKIEVCDFYARELIFFFAVDELEA